MAIKMRVLCYPEKKKLLAIGNMIKAEYDLSINAVDRSPPAYPCDKERIVVLGLTVGDYIPDQLRLFCRELTKERAQNVALYIDGTEANANKIKDILKEAGTNVIDEVCFVKGGLPFKFISKITDDEKTAVLEWADRVVAQLA